MNDFSIALFESNTVLAIISGSNLPILKIPKDLSPSYCHRAVEKKRMKIG